MNTNENNEKPKTARESGVAENERANYSGFPQEDNDDRAEKDDKKNIQETDSADEREKGAGDIAGNAAGNTPTEEE